MRPRQCQHRLQSATTPEPMPKSWRYMLVKTKLRGRSMSYQLESASCHDKPSDVGLPAMMISHIRIVLATTGTNPIDKINASAARCFLLNFNSGSNGSGKTSNTTSVATLMAAEVCMKMAILMQPCGFFSISQIRDTGVQAKNCACSKSSVTFFSLLEI